MRVGEGVDEALGRHRVEARLPPEGEDAQHARASIDPRFDPSDETVAEQDRQDVVPPATLRLRDVDLPDVVEVPEPAQQLAIPGQRIERRQERDAGPSRPGVDPSASSRRAAARRSRSSATMKRVPRTPSTSTGTRARPRGARRVARRRSGGLPGADEDLGLTAGPQQAVGAIPRQQLVAALLVAAAASPRAGPPGTAARRGRRCGDCRRAATGRGCPASASASRIARTGLVGRQYQSIAGPRLEVGRRQRAVPPDPVEQLLDEGRVRRRRCPPSWPSRIRSQVIRYHGISAVGHQRQALVVGLVQGPGVVQVAVRPGAPVARDPGAEDQVVVAPGDVERVELERPEPVDDREHARRIGRQGPRRCEQVAEDEEPARGRAVEDEWSGHPVDGTGSHATVARSSGSG